MPDRAGPGRSRNAGDGIVTGVGKIDGRFAVAIAYDFTVMAGSMGRNRGLKGNRAREIALTQRIPIGLADRLCRRTDPGSHRLAELAATGLLFP